MVTPAPPFGGAEIVRAVVDERVPGPRSWRSAPRWVPPQVVVGDSAWQLSRLAGQGRRTPPHPRQLWPAPQNRTPDGDVVRARVSRRACPIETSGLKRRRQAPPLLPEVSPGIAALGLPLGEALHEGQRRVGDLEPA